MPNGVESHSDPGSTVAPSPLAVTVVARDPISRAGVTAELGTRHELCVVGAPGSAAVAILVVDEIDAAAQAAVTALVADGCGHVVVVATSLDDAAVLRAVEGGAGAIVRRAEATATRLSEAVHAVVAGRRTGRPDLAGSVFVRAAEREQAAAHPPRGLLVSGYAEREIEVLRLVADGLGTAEIAATLAYSERTVKNVLHDVTCRFDLRNRCHAVAHALRAGVI
jgi:DNA-binding NarL/FixJ family response regulator